MKKYSAEWKREQMNKAGGWAQKHETEYTGRQAFATMRECAGANGQP